MKGLDSNTGILTGVAHGPTRAAVTTVAENIASSYFDVPPDHITIELSNERIEDVVYTQGGERMSVRFAADFRAEVI